MGCLQSSFIERRVTGIRSHSRSRVTREIGLLRFSRSKAQEFTFPNPTRQVLNKAENGSKSQRLAKGTSSVGFVVVGKTLLLSLKDSSSQKEQCSQKRRRVFGEG